MDRRLKRYVKAAFFLIMLSAVSMDSHAYTGQNKDYFFTEKLTENRGKTHYLEFTNKETYTVKPGDTLWNIAEDYWGKGTYYQKILSDNENIVDAPEYLMPGMELDLEKKLYMNVGIEDYTHRDLFGDSLLTGKEAFDMGRFGLQNNLPYCIYPNVPYANDLKETDPYMHWEEFKEEINRCSKEICGGLVSDLSFERYQVTGIGNLCGYSFTFDAGDKEYVIMAYFCYNETTKSEAVALCEKKRCTERTLELVRGKTCYAAVRFLDPKKYYEKTQDYDGAEMWKYPQLRNPFVAAMRQLYSGPLKQMEDYQEDYAILWEEPEFEKLVREELSKLWQLTEEEKQTFAQRDITAADLALIEEMLISYHYIEQEGKEYLCVLLNKSKGYGTSITHDLQTEGRLMDTLKDLGHFHGLKSLHIDVHTFDIIDLSFLENLTDLKVLCMYFYYADTQVKNLELLGKLAGLRTLRIDGWFAERKRGYEYYEYHGCKKYLRDGHKRFSRGITDLSVLRSCPRLAYLTLNIGNLESYDFLEDLPELYQISLYGTNVGEDVEPLLPNACFIEINGEWVRFECGEGFG